MTNLDRIHTVTFTVPNAAEAAAIYARWLGYETIWSGAVDPVLAALWGAPRLEGAASILMQPASQADFPFRFVEQPRDPAYLPLRHYGWNAAEIVVANVYDLPQKLSGSPFAIIGPPAPLEFAPDISAMQVVGPFGEVLYFTEIAKPVAGFDLPKAASPIDRVFVSILAVSDLAETLAWFSRVFGAAAGPAFETAVPIIAAPHGLPADTPFRLTTINLTAQTLIEIDAFPRATSLPREPREGALPPAQAMMSFAVERIDESLPFIAPPQPLVGPPYRGARAAVLRGPEGALFELIEMA